MIQFIPRRNTKILIIIWDAMESTVGVEMNRVILYYTNYKLHYFQPR